jgi:calreticulin
MKFSLLAATLAVAPAAAEIYFKEQFNDEAWKTKWVESTKWRSADEMGSWEQTPGKFYADKNDMGLKTADDARFYGLSAKMDKSFKSSDKKDLVIQYSVKHEQGIDCGGAYIKLLPGGDKFDSAKFGGDTPYGVMFGPDICGNTKRTHAILHSHKKSDNLLIKNDVPCEKDEFTHLYTFLVKPDNTFEIFVDNKSVRSGPIEDSWDFLEPKEIPDPSQSKPADWVDEKMIADPDDIKPEGYDDMPAEIPDPDAQMPDDWDEEDDGEWEPPMVDNPDYNGPWKPKLIPNPEYKGEWIHPKIPNPDFSTDDTMYAVCGDEGCSHVGFEIWQVKAGTIFDDILITDSLEEAQEFAEKTFFAKKDGEREMYDDMKDEEPPIESEAGEDFGGDDFNDEF